MKAHVSYHHIRGSLLALLVLALAIMVWTSSPKVAAPALSAPPPQPKDVVSYSTTKPSQQVPTSTTYVSTATGNEPSYIKLPTIQGQGYVEKVGIDQSGAVAAPNNINLAGWYVNSLSPGEQGLSIIDGHVDGYTAPGIFYKLNKLSAGDQFEVDLANGTAETFVVKSVAEVSALTAATDLFTRDYSIASQLNLITCGGPFDRVAGLYTERVIVVSSLLN